MHTQQEIIEAVNKNVDLITDLISEISEDQLRRSENGKWSVAENLVHLNKAVAPINIALSLPKISFLVFGKADVHRSYDEVVAAYQLKLKQGAVASLPYVPSKRSKQIGKDRLIQEFKEHYSVLVTKLAKWSESELDRYRLPHPIIGKMTMREMLFFTVYHIKHHYITMQKLS